MTVYIETMEELLELINEFEEEITREYLGLEIDDAGLDKNQFYLDPINKLKTIVAIEDERRKKEKRHLDEALNDIKEEIAISEEDINKIKERLMADINLRFKTELNLSNIQFNTYKMVLDNCKDKLR